MPSSAPANEEQEKLDRSSNAPEDDVEDNEFTRGAEEEESDGMVLNVPSQRGG